MSNTYRNITTREAFGAKPGEVFEGDFDATTEADLLGGKRIELVPRDYEVVGTRQVCETEPGKRFKGAFTVGQEAALLEAGHIERVGPKKPLGK